MALVEGQHIAYLSSLDLRESLFSWVALEAPPLPPANAADEIAKTYRGGPVQVDDRLGGFGETLFGLGHGVEKIKEGLEGVHGLVGLALNDANHKVFVVNAGTFDVSGRRRIGQAACLAQFLEDNIRHAAAAEVLVV